MFNILQSTNKWLKKFGWSWRRSVLWSNPKESKLGLDTEDYAMIDFSLSDRQFTIEYNELRQEEMSESVTVHELLHITFDALDVVVEPMIEKLTDEKTSSILKNIYHSEEDRVIDELAGLIVRVSGGGQESD